MYIEFVSYSQKYLQFPSPHVEQSQLTFRRATKSLIFTTSFHRSSFFSIYFNLQWPARFTICIWPPSYTLFTTFIHQVKALRRILRPVLIPVSRTSIDLRRDSVQRTDFLQIVKWLQTVACSSCHSAIFHTPHSSRPYFYFPSSPHLQHPTRTCSNLFTCNG